MYYNLAKIVDGNLEWYKQPNHILGDATQYGLDNGYKPVISQYGDGGIYETTENIVIETPQVVMTNDDIRIARENCYREQSDSLFIAYQKYLALGEADKAEASRLTWLAKIEEIDQLFPYI